LSQIFIDCDFSASSDGAARSKKKLAAISPKVHWNGLLSQILMKKKKKPPELNILQLIQRFNILLRRLTED